MKIGILLPVLGGILVWTAFIRAQEPAENNAAPTVVFGAAATPDGGQNTFVVEQPKDAPNPLGDPIAVDNTPPQVFDIQEGTEKTTTSADPAGANQPSETGQVANPALNQGDLPAEAQELGKDFQNTLMEADGRIYDIQSYPEQDIGVMGNSADPQTIYSPNVND